MMRHTHTNTYIYTYNNTTNKPNTRTIMAIFDKELLHVELLHHLHLHLHSQVSSSSLFCAIELLVARRPGNNREESSTSDVRASIEFPFHEQ